MEEHVFLQSVSLIDSGDVTLGKVMVFLPQQHVHLVASVLI